jgi:hypothetical protein
MKMPELSTIIWAIVIVAVAIFLYHKFIRPEAK